MPKRTRAYHEFLLEQLTDPIFAAEYLNEARQDSSRKIFLKALRNVAEAHRMAVLAAETGLNRESLYKSLSEEGNPRLETYESVLAALSLDYVFKPKQITLSSTPNPIESSEDSDVSTIRITSTKYSCENATFSDAHLNIIYFNQFIEPKPVSSNDTYRPQDVPMFLVATNTTTETLCPI